jgi:hypothetical protein
MRVALTFDVAWLGDRALDCDHARNSNGTPIKKGRGNLASTPTGSHMVTSSM